jgi:pimeloyl-ACP methyl ester carboxylesterase
MNMLARSLLAGAFAWLLTAGVASATILPPLPAPVATFEAGSLRVQQFGSGPQALVFIPGLTCGPWEWSGEIERLSPHYTIYALTLPGFDGQPPIAGPLFQTVSADFWNLLASKHIVKPVVIGHSLGGTLGFLLATQHPERLRAVVAVDGLPILPAMNFVPAAQRASIAQQTQAQIAGTTQAQFAAYEKSMVMPSLVTSPADSDAIAALTGTANPAETGRWLQEDMLLDLRPQLSKATVPILLVAPFDTTIDGMYHMTSPDQKRAFYAMLVAGAPDLRIDMVPNSRHFVMYDQPQALANDIAQFLSQVAP